MHTLEGPNPGPRFPALASVVLVVLGVLTGAILLLLSGRQRDLPINWLCLLVQVTTVVFLARRARPARPARGLFGMLALALAIHTLWSGLRLLPMAWSAWLRQGDNLGFALLQMTMPLLQMVAILSWNEPGSGQGLRGRALMDALIFSGTLFVICWMLGLADLQSSGAFSAREKILQNLFFLDYALLAGLTLYRCLNAPQQFRGPLGWLLGAYLCLTAGNLGWVWLVTRGRLYHPGSALDALAVLAAGLFLVASLAPLPRPGRAKPVRKLGVLVAPYLPIFLALPVGIHYALGTRHPGLVVLSWIRPGLAVLVLARQFVALRDLHRFSRGLENTIQERTSSLEELQTVLLRNQRMNLLATLGAGVAHDLNNLLSIAMLTTDKLAFGLEDGLPPRAEDLDQLHSALGKASGMTAKLLAYGRSPDMAEQRFELNGKLLSLQPMLEQLGGRSVQVALELAPEPLWLDQDPAQIEQVLLNLTINARDAMPAGGRLRIHTRSAEARRQVILEVADTGIGIPNEILPRLFEPFFTTKQPGKGTGLGLASVKAIVEGCGGQIAIRSQVGQGTTFCLGFPVSVAKETDPFLLAGLS